MTKLKINKFKLTISNSLCLGRVRCWGLSPRCFQAGVRDPCSGQLVSNTTLPPTLLLPAEINTCRDPSSGQLVQPPLSLHSLSINWTPAEPNLTPQWRSRQDGGWGGGRPGHCHQRLSHTQVLPFYDVGFLID